ncbi:hypothetical protein ULMS_10360 [Patiriisocius marinistellae]|uniref:Uncharacterized protein n=1 Tax=Patiriisocius marinistellae TaxID=2494560 RepID=A0A5J4FWB6_9FLAO|nr:hypothetical protein [Patiriisocius marinistellae]GEQ85528.1 hypothetical protein ULMS_10360 [Patiriisocius marinistellae]
MLLVVNTTFSYSQVGINTTSPAVGALLDISASNKGFLLPKVSLTSTADTTTITPSATVGLLVYNTVTSGALPFQVTPGFYYWNGSQWLRFYNRGYGIKFDQESQTTASILSSVYTQISDLDTGFISVPYSGTYQIKVETAYACGNLSNTSSEGVGQASISLNMTTGIGLPVRVKERYVTSTSKRIGSVTLNNIPQNTTIIYTVDLNLLNTYRFNVTGREWSRNNVGLGTFGKNTNGYPGASGVNNAQRGSISITLLKQQ